MDSVDSIQKYKDPYRISVDTIKEAPGTIWQRFRFLGPGFILSASIVGSGELIATTILGAKAGFIVLWVIIVSCLAKVTVQLEFGRHAIVTGERCMQALSKLPGPKNWAVFTLLMLVGLKIIQLGGMLGGTAVILQILFPQLPISAWAVIAAAAVAILIYNGQYKLIEKVSLFMIAMFTLLTLASLFAVQFTEYRFDWFTVFVEQRLHIPSEVMPFAIGAFGITGVASDEIIAYNYWCLEKGYAAYAGPPSGDEAWKQRAEGWIKVMYLDATVAMIIYTVVTVAFYLLGAAVLHGREEIPQGNEVIETLALIYTRSLGDGVRIAYLIGGFFVLFSSLFATLGAWTRIFPDIFGVIGTLHFDDLKQRKKMIATLSLVFPVLWTVAYLFINKPVLMVLFGGVVGSVMLFIVVAGALHFHYGRPQPVPSGKLYNIALWISCLSVAAVGIYGIVEVLRALT